ncbi:MAG: hypothetical protein HY840_05935 [Bacteroidetes bacterium]|nr:hypothetical protein [Bacteroidota bacterium]
MNATLLTLFTFESSPFEREFLTAFDSRLDYEKTEHNQIINTNQFNESIKILLNGFITSVLHDTKPPVRQFSFINPSLTDFLIGHVSDSLPERKSIISSLVFFEQLNRFNPEKSLIPLEKELQIIIRDRISKSKITSRELHSKYFSENKRHAITLEALCKYCHQVNIDTLLLEHFKQIAFTESWDAILQKLEYVLLHLGDAPQTFNYIKENFIKIIEKIMDTIVDSDNAKQIPILFSKYEYSYDDYTESDEGSKRLIGVIEIVLQSSEDDLKSERQDEIKNIDEVTNLYDEIYSLERELKYELFPNTSFDYNFGVEIDRTYWKDKIEDNIVKAARNDAMNEKYDEDYYKEARFESNSEENAIDDLFIKSE